MVETHHFYASLHASELVDDWQQGLHAHVKELAALPKTKKHIVVCIADMQNVLPLCHKWKRDLMFAAVPSR